jgi:hypothetical protein
MGNSEISEEISFTALISGLMAEALASMGMLDHPSVKGIKKDLDHAKAVISTIKMLKEKTSGNLTEQESKLLEEVLHQLRLGYVSAAEAKEPSDEPGVEKQGEGS